MSTVAYRTDLFRRDLNNVLITDFFGSVRNVELLSPHLRLVDDNKTLADDSSVDRYIVLCVALLECNVHQV